MGGTVHDLEFHEPVGQEAQAPLRVPLWRRATGQGDEVRFLLPIELGSAAGTALRPTVERRLHALFKAAPPLWSASAMAWSLRPSSARSSVRARR